MKPSRPTPAVRVRLAAAVLPFSLSLIGCGEPAPAPVAPDTVDPAAGPAEAPADPDVKQARFAPFPDSAGRRWLTKTIPYDAFATAPGGAAAAGDAAPARPAARDLLAGIGTGSARSPLPAVTAAGDRPGGRGAMIAPSMGGSVGGGTDEEGDGTGWAAVISAEDLRDEIKRARNAIAAAVGTVAAFNRDRESLPNEAATLAAMAQITADHPGRVPWKANADAVRTLAVRVGEAAGSRGRTARDAARGAFDPLDSILGGNPPPDGAVAEFDRQLDAPRAALMQRMQTALDYLQQEAPDAAAMNRNGGDLARQAAALAALSRFTADEAYDSAAEADYQRWSAELTAAATDAAGAARESPDYEAYRAAVARAAATCTACHGAYRF